MIIVGVLYNKIEVGDNFMIFDFSIDWRYLKLYNFLICLILFVNNVIV